MKNIISIVLMFSLSQMGVSQNYAGPDTTICSGSPVMIGIPSTNSTYCYLWDAAEGMPESERYVAQPTVSPKHNTVYRVSVRGPRFKEIATDQVNVFVDFGPVNATPQYVNIGESEIIQSTAVLQKDGGKPFLWLVVDEDNTGCFINSFSGEVTNCTTTGTFKFKAQAINDLNCDVEHEIDINLGVKDLFAKDEAKPNRIAKASKGETLYFVDTTALAIPAPTKIVKVRAIPNKGGIFGNGTPEWSGTLPGTEIGNDLFSGNISDTGDYTISAAADKTIAIEYIDDDREVFAGLFSIQFIKNIIKYIRRGNPSPPGTACPPAPGYFFGLSLASPSNEISIDIQTSKVEKFGNPGWGDKISVRVPSPVTASVCGKAPIPGATYTFPFGPELIAYVSVTGGLGIGLNATYDESKENAFSGQADLTGSLTVTAGVEVDVGVPGVEVLANIELSTKAIVAALGGYPDIKIQPSIGGLSGRLQATIIYGNPSTSYSFYKDVTLLDAKKFDPIIIYSFE